MYGEIIKSWPHHLWIDYTSREKKFGAVKPLPIRAGVTGPVTFSTSNGLWNVAEIKIDNYILRYMHLDSFEWEDREVKQGEVIGYTGNTGAHSTAAHLHFDVKEDGVIIDQTEWLIDDNEMEEQEPISLFEAWTDTEERLLVSDETALWLDDVLTNAYHAQFYSSEAKDVIYAEVDWVCYSWTLNEHKDAHKEEIDSIPEDAIKLVVEAEADPELNL